MKKYIIWAPKYGKSNGVRILYKLAEELEKKGYEAYVWGETEDYKNVKYIKEITEDNRQNDIIVYPEIVWGNPLEFRNVARWILYYPGKLRGPKKFDKSELLFVFNRIYFSEGDILLFDTLDRKLFFKDSTPKDIDCYFVYKKGKWKYIPEFDTMTEITFTYPETREELSKLLRRTKTLYSYDDCSQLLDEAILCGCKVKLVRENGFEDYNPVYKNLDYEEYLDNFIRKTQAMNYIGKIKKTPLIKRLFYKKYLLKYLFFKYIIKNNEKEKRNISKYRLYKNIKSE